MGVLAPPGDGVEHAQVIQPVHYKLQVKEMQSLSSGLSEVGQERSVSPPRAVQAPPPLLDIMSLNDVG